METIRQKQVGELIRRSFSQILTQEGAYVYGREVLVTITNVRMTPDFAAAKVYISVWNTENKQEVLLQLEDALPRLKQSLFQKIGKQMRRMPDLEFHLDDTIDEMYKVDTLMNRVMDEDKNLGE